MARPRISIDMTPTQERKLDRLADQTGCATRAEVTRRALDVFDTLISATRGGGQVYVADAAGGNKRLILLPVLGGGS